MEGFVRDVQYLAKAILILEWSPEYFYGYWIRTLQENMYCSVKNLFLAKKYQVFLINKNLILIFRISKPWHNRHRDLQGPCKLSTIASIETLWSLFDPFTEKCAYFSTNLAFHEKQMQAPSDSEKLDLGIIFQLIDMLSMFVCDTVCMIVSVSNLVILLNELHTIIAKTWFIKVWQRRCLFLCFSFPFVFWSSYQKNPL